MLYYCKALKIQTHKMANGSISICEHRKKQVWDANECKLKCTGIERMKSMEEKTTTLKQTVKTIKIDDQQDKPKEVNLLGVEIKEPYGSYIRDLADKSGLPATFFVNAIIENTLSKVK